MRRRANTPPLQLTLSLQRELTNQPTAQDSTALLQALADLLLGALGETVEEPATPEGGANDSEDHV